MGRFFSDLHFAWRSACRNPGYSFLIVGVLAIGIGANVAVFGLANAAFFRPLPYRHADRLAFLWQSNERTGEPEGAVSYPNYADWRAQSRSFHDMAFLMFAKEIFGGQAPTEILNSEKGPERVPAVLVSTNFFSVLGIQPLLGRAFVPGDSLRGKSTVVVISYALWKARFGGSPHVLGERLGFSESQTDTVVGVMPPDFTFPLGTQIWKPRQAIMPGKFDLRIYPNMGVVGRLSAGVTWKQAQAEMHAIAARLANQYPKDDGGVGIRLVPLREQLSEKVRQGLLILWAAIFGVLLIACVNAANLLMARAVGRQKEIAVRFSLGATRAHIVRQFLAETFLLALGGTLVGSMLASWVVVLVSKFNPDIARLGSSLIDVRVLLYTTAAAAFTAVLCAVIPAFSTSRFDLNRVLKESGSGSASRRARTVREVLVVTEVALSLILLVGCGLLIRSLWKILSVNPGFDAERVYVLNVSFPGVGPAQYRIFRQVMDRIRGLPGVVAVGCTSNLLFPTEMYKPSFTIEGAPNSAALSPTLTVEGATPSVFPAMSVPFLLGRPFTEADIAEKARPVVIINEAMARRYWPNESPIGQRFKLNDPNYPQPWQTIVGVVGDVRQEGLEKSPGNLAYFPYEGQDGDDIVIRSTDNPQILFGAVRSEVAAVDKNFVIGRLVAARQVLYSHESQRRFNAWLLTVFAFIALLLATTGIYASVSYWVRQRTQEIGIRTALGAGPRDIFVLVIVRGMSSVLMGLVLGVAGAFTLATLISSMLFRIVPSDPATYAAVVGLFAIVALAACYFPARRAMKVDPMIVLRYE